MQLLNPNVVVPLVETIATFRTECEYDGKNVPALLAELGLTIQSSRIIEDRPGYNLCVFAIVIPQDLSIAEVKNKMELLVGSDERFVDMHRCFQTFAEGNEPNEEWYLT